MVDGTYLCFLANGEAEKISLEEVQQRMKDRTAMQARQGTLYPFVPELLLSLIDFIAKYPKEHAFGPPYTHWRQLFHLHSREAWLTVRCRDCQKVRRIALRFMSILHQRQHEGLWKRCSMLLGVDCSKEETMDINVVNLKAVFTALQRSGNTELPEQGPQQSVLEEMERDGRDLASEYGGTQASVEIMRYSPELIEMWKSLGKSLKQPAYAGEGNPNQLSAWQEEVEMFLQVYQVRGEAQVIAATKFLRGEAEEWWRGIQATGRHRQITSLEQLCKELKKRFFPLDRLERMAKQWVKLEQKASVEEYHEEFCLLQAAFPLGERAEFMLAYQGLRANMRAKVRQALDDESREQLPMDRLFALAQRAEVRECRVNEVAGFARRGQVPLTRYPNNQANRQGQTAVTKTSTSPSGKAGGATRKPGDKGMSGDRAGLLREYPCWVCDKRGHFIRDCPDAHK